MFETKVIGKIKIHILCAINFVFSRKSYHLCDNVEKYCRAGQATDGSTIPRMQIVCWITKAKNAHSESVIRIAFPLQQW